MNVVRAQGEGDAGRQSYIVNRQCPTSCDLRSEPAIDDRRVHALAPA